MLTSSASRSLVTPAGRSPTVTDVASLAAAGWTSDAVRGQVRALRWQRLGRAVILHNGTPTAAELRSAALVVLGPRSMLTSFTSLEEWGLAGWERDDIHVLVPRGARVVRPRGLPMRVHYTDSWSPNAMNAVRRLHRPAAAAVRAASSFRSPRPACAVLAACVQQRLVRPAEVVDAVVVATKTRHRAQLLLAAQDIAQGAQALNEIDLALLCRRARLPEPVRQAVRRIGGRRRYLDAEWRRPDGRRLVVEVDGALHLAVRRWWDDQSRQNELVLGGDVVLRYPSVIVRTEPQLVVGQIRRALLVDLPARAVTGPTRRRKIGREAG